MPTELEKNYRDRVSCLFALGVLSEKPDELEVLQVWSHVRNDQIFMEPRIAAMRANEAYPRTFFEDFALLSAEEKDALRDRVLSKGPRR